MKHNPACHNYRTKRARISVPLMLLAFSSLALVVAPANGDTTAEKKKQNDHRSIDASCGVGLIRPASDPGEVDQLAELWDSVIQQSPDIQDLLNKLTPASGQQPRIALRLLSSALIEAGGAPGNKTNPRPVMALTDPNLEPTYPGQLGYSTPYLLPIQAKQEVVMAPQLADSSDSKRSHSQRLAERDEIMLWRIADRAAGKLVQAYRDL